MNEAKQKAAQEVVEVARAVLHGAKLSDAMVDEWIIKGEDGRALWSALRGIGMSPDCYLTTDSSKPFADERAKVGDVVMHKHNSPGLHMCAVEGVHLAVEEVTDRYVSVRGDGVRSKWIRIDHGWYEIVKRAEEKRIPQVGEFWRHVGADIVGCVDRKCSDPKNFYFVAVADCAWCHEWAVGNMEFAFPARKDGEFKVGDTVEFSGLEWGVRGFGSKGFVSAFVLIGRESDEAWVRPEDFALKVPVEMRGSV